MTAQLEGIEVGDGLRLIDRAGDADALDDPRRQFDERAGIVAVFLERLFDDPSFHLLVRGWHA